MEKVKEETQTVEPQLLKFHEDSNLGRRFGTRHLEGIHKLRTGENMRSDRAAFELNASVRTTVMDHVRPHVPR